jgi:hypothetical protein
MIRIVRTAVLTLGVAVAIATISLPARADVAVLVNGQSVNFDQPPITRAGRVFVPLRGVFERLGASVVYDNGQINATGNGRNIALNIGSTQATVNGSTQVLDVAPFVIGSRTLVPLRFVAQALGAGVEWDQNAQTVRITGGGGNGGGMNQGPPASTLQLVTMFPTGTSRRSVSNLRATFSVPVQRDSVRVRVDGVDVTTNTDVTSTGFNTTLPQQLSEGSHSVRVTGMTRDGTRFATGWTFQAIAGL